MSARTTILLLVAALTIPGALHAQQQASPARTAAQAGPRIDASAVAARRAATTADTASAAAQRSRQNVTKPVALMIVGGAAIILGSVISDPAGALFVIGGAVALLYGLYLYLQ